MSKQDIVEDVAQLLSERVRRGDYDHAALNRSGIVSRQIYAVLDLLKDLNILNNDAFAILLSKELEKIND